MVTRRVAGVTTREVAPFSFQSLYAITRQKGEIPSDPYDMVRWPIVRRGRTAYVRYRFHTRSFEMFDPLKRLARAVPNVRIALVTHCLDDGDFAAYTLAKGRMKGKWLGDNWRAPFWERAASDLGISVDEAYEEDAAETLAESMMLDAAMRVATGDDRHYDWSGGRVYRDLWDQRAAMMRDLSMGLKGLEEE